MNEENTSTTEILRQRFAKFAKVVNILKENNIDHEKQQLLYENDIVPSEDIELAMFQSPIHFQLIDTRFSVFITIINTDNDNSHSLKFHCSSSITMKRLLDIACQLFHINQHYYYLYYESR
ncbi:unnamed protein product, partial [Rotaria sp. Silwood2]